MGVNIIVQIFLIPLYLKYLGKRDFGIFMVILSVMNCASIGIGWMSGGALRVLGEHYAGRRYAEFARIFYVSRIIYVGYAIGIVGIIFCLLALSLNFGFPFSLQPTRQFWILIAICALYFIISYDFAIERIAFNSMQMQHIGNLFQILYLLLFAAIAVPALVQGATLVGLVSCMLASVIVSRVLSRLFYVRISMPRVSHEPIYEFRAIGKLFVGKTGMGYFCYGVILLAMQSDILFMGWLGGVNLAADYALVWKIAEVIIQVLWKIPEYLQPKLIHLDAIDDRQGLVTLYRKSIRWMNALGFLCALLYASFGYEIVKTWTRTNDVPRDRLIYILGGAAIFWISTSRVPAVFAGALARFSFLLRISALELAMKVILVLFLVKEMGILAPLLAISVIHVGGMAYYYRTFSNELQVAVD
jgi:O-antigen/teichoic acid export membrane protein